MNVFVRELRVNQKSSGLWLLGLVFLTAASVGKMSGMVGENSAVLTAMLLLLPSSMRALFGVGSVDFTQPIGIFAVVGMYIALISAMHASSLGSSVFAREERDKTFEFLYVRGMPRARILLSKLAAGLALMLALNLATYAVGALLTRLLLHESVASPLIPIMAGVLIIQVLSFAIGLLASFLTRRMSLATSIASGVVMALFLLAMLADLTGISAFGAVTPFKLFDGKVVMTAGLNGPAALACLALSAALGALSLCLHSRRDLNA